MVYVLPGPLRVPQALLGIPQRDRNDAIAVGVNHQHGLLEALLLTGEPSSRGSL